jgi:hypothetical protein
MSLLNDRLVISVTPCLIDRSILTSSYEPNETRMLKE